MALSAEAQLRSEQLLERGWRFSREDNAEFSRAEYDDSA
jgi:beta-galactosidase